MSRRASHASVGVSRRQSVQDARNKRFSLREGSLTGAGVANRLATINDVKEGDTIYRTERLYPSIADHPEDIHIAIAKWQREPRSGSTMSMSRDETATPSENSPSHERDRYP